MKKIVFILITFILFLFGLNQVEAATSSCHYDSCSEGFTIKYDTETGKINIDSSGNRYCAFDFSSISANNFIKDGKLVCPTLYYSVSGSGRTASYKFYSTKKDDLYKLEYNKEKSNIPNVDLNTIKNCSVTYGNYTLTITVDTKEKVIKGYAIPGYQVNGTLLYDDIISDGKCKKDATVYITCSVRGGNYCSISSSYISGSTSGSSSPITGSSDPDDLNDNDSANNGQYQPGEEVYGCNIIPPEITKWIKNILNIVKYVALALVIALGALDFMKAAGSGEPDQMKKAGQSFMKRVAAVVILFLVPVIVDLILNLINLYGAGGTCIE